MPEYLWCTLAAALAGVGTGLVGLSAATAMVPILIVLCPSLASKPPAVDENPPGWYTENRQIHSFRQRR